MSVGTWIGDQFSNLTGQSLPMYVGSMFVAVTIQMYQNMRTYNSSI